MGFFDSLKNFKQQIDQVESTLYTGKQSLLEVYERNAKLEIEIATRTKELEIANKQMLTLQHIWEMMNSAKPLSNMLETIVNTLHDAMGYEYAAVLELKKDEDDEDYHLSIRATSSHTLLNKLMAYMPEGLETYKAPYLPNSIIAKAINERKVYSTPDIKGVIRMMFPQVSEEKFKD